MHEQAVDTAEDNQKVIDEAWQEGMDLISPILKKNNTAKYALQRFNEKWEQDLEFISKDIKNDHKINQDRFFRWGLVRQECEMYCLIGEQVDPEELEKLCKKRGLNHEKKCYMVETMKYAGLGEEL
jgi:hypothetical protein